MCKYRYGSRLENVEKRPRLWRGKVVRIAEIPHYTSRVVYVPLPPFGYVQLGWLTTDQPLLQQYKGLQLAKRTASFFRIKIWLPGKNLCFSGWAVGSEQGYEFASQR